MAEYAQDFPFRNPSVASVLRNESLPSTIRNQSLSSVYSADKVPQVPEPHIPLRKASAHRLRSRAPHPLFIKKEGGLTGFTPPTSGTTATSSQTPAVVVRSAASSRHDTTQYDIISAEDTVAFQTRERSGTTSALDNSRPSESPRDRSRASEPVGSGFRRLRSSRSVSDGLRHLRERLSKHNIRDVAVPNTGRSYISSNVPPQIPANIDRTEQRTSVRSGWTSASSCVETATTNTERSSTFTKHSSTSDLNKTRSGRTIEPEEEFSVDDAIGMYESGFGTPPASMTDLNDGTRRDDDVRPTTSPSFAPREATLYGPPSHTFQRSLSAANLSVPAGPAAFDLPKPYYAKGPLIRSSTQIMSGRGVSMMISDDNIHAEDASNQDIPALIPRDRYGFKKVSHHVTLDAYDRWDAGYEQHLARRWRKWQDLMKANGLDTDNPVRFPTPNEKVKRYVRKGIPAAWRGAAWFWYAGGPGLQEKHQGLYFTILHRIKHDDVLSLTDREHIERDLDRTFPDNIRFKADPAQMTGEEVPETSIVRALRRLLQAFAVHNPAIGYCQSLNFIAGLLLLFLDEDEEKAFILLNIITTQFLPGTHGVSLEGANIDIAVLMSSLKETLPAIWMKLEDRPLRPVVNGPAPLPTVSLATTAWFMSLFVGTLPIESVLRVWDCLFLEGSKTLFRIALTIFKMSEAEIHRVNDSMEVFQIVQSTPRGMLDVNGMMDVCFRRRHGFVNITQEVVEKRRNERRAELKAGRRPHDQAGPPRLGPSKSFRGRLRSKTKGG